LKHSANLFHDKAVTKVAVVLSRLPVTGGEDEKDMRRLVNVCGGCGTREQSIETRFGLAKGDKLVNSRIVGVKAWRDSAAAMDCKVSPQRITSAPAWVGTASRPLVKRPKEELRELVRCNRGEPLSPHRLASLRYQRVRWIRCDELRQVGRLEGEATLAARYRPRPGPISCSFFGIGLTERNS
jgi:hypothetical protein